MVNAYIHDFFTSDPWQFIATARLGPSIMTVGSRCPAGLRRGCEMMAIEFKKGDRVIANHRSSVFNGRPGTVTYVSEGGLYWVRFDDFENIEGPLFWWWLDPLVTEAQREAIVA